MRARRGKGVAPTGRAVGAAGSAREVHGGINGAAVHDKPTTAHGKGAVETTVARGKGGRGICESACWRDYSDRAGHRNRDRRDRAIAPVAEIIDALRLQCMAAAGGDGLHVGCRAAQGSADRHVAKDGTAIENQLTALYARDVVRIRR